jgi:GDP-L-fucose synthase
MRIVVTGSSGFLGHHVMPVLKNRYGEQNVIGLSSKNYDLLDRYQVRKMFEETQPDVLVHLAAYSGGIGINRTKPADFYFINIMLQALIFEESAYYGKLIKLNSRLDCV